MPILPFLLAIPIAGTLAGTAVITTTSGLKTIPEGYAAPASTPLAVAPLTTIKTTYPTTTYLDGGGAGGGVTAGAPMVMGAVVM